MIREQTKRFTIEALPERSSLQRRLRLTQAFAMTPFAGQTAKSKYVPVVELDTIKASDAFGPGSSPGGHTIKTLVI